jgi:hypothetical protein
MAEANKTVSEVLNELGKKLSQQIKDRDAEIDRIDALPAQARGKAKYEAVNETGKPVIVAIVAGELTKTGIENAVKAGKIRRVEAEKTDGRFAKYKELTKAVTVTIDAIKQAAVSRKPKAGVRTSTGSGGGSHVITKAWFDKHAAECPKAMGVAWDDTNNRITYNLPKGGRGSTTSHGALNNIVLRFGGKTGSATQTSGAKQPAVVPKKVVPAKKNEAGPGAKSAAKK